MWASVELCDPDQDTTPLRYKERTLVEPFHSRDVERKFASYPPVHREALEMIRTLIFDIANSTEGVGPLEETLKWGEPAYLTTKCKSGTTLRIDWKEREPDFYGVYVHCQTDLIERFRKRFKDFDYEGTRCLRIPVERSLPVEALAVFIREALTYHRTK